MPFTPQVGDASGIQSPVSFGGFGSLTRHLGRLSNGLSTDFFVNCRFHDHQIEICLLQYKKNLAKTLTRTHANWNGLMYV